MEALNALSPACQKKEKKRNSRQVYRFTVNTSNVESLLPGNTAELPEIHLASRVNEPIKETETLAGREAGRSLSVMRLSHRG